MSASALTSAPASALTSAPASAPAPASASAPIFQEWGHLNKSIIDDSQIITTDSINPTSKEEYYNSTVKCLI